MADPNTFDYFRSGEPMPTLAGVNRTTGFDYFRSGEPFPGLITTASVKAFMSVAFSAVTNAAATFTAVTSGAVSESATTNAVAEET